MTEKFQRFASASCFICLFAYAATLCVSHACNNEINRLFHITNTQMGVLFMMIYVGFIPATLLTGRLSDTKGKLPVVFAGGVSSDGIIREYLSKRIDCEFASVELSSDNAVGTAILAQRKYTRSENNAKR